MFLDVDGTTKGRLELDFPHHGGILATGVRLLCARLEELVRMAIGTKRKREPTSLNNHNTCQYVSCPEIHRVTSLPESPSQSRISAFGNPYVQCSKQGHQKQASFAVCIVFNFNFFLLLLNLSPKKKPTFRPFSPLYVVIHKTVFDSLKKKLNGKRLHTSHEITAVFSARVFLAASREHSHSSKAQGRREWNAV